MQLLLLLLLGCLFGCSRPDEVPVTPIPSDTPDPTTRWDEIQEITNASCLSCHEGAGFLSSERSFLIPKVKGRIQRREMPPPSSAESRAMPQAVRDKLVGFFE